MFPSHDNHFSGPNARLSPTASLVPNPAHFSLSYVPERDRPMPDPIGTPLSAKRKSESKSPSPPQLNKLDEMSENRKFAFDMLKKIVEGNGGSLSKSQVTRLLNVLNADKDILPMVEISTRDFGQIVDSQPDLAAEILLQIHSAGSSNVYKCVIFERLVSNHFCLDYWMFCSKLNYRYKVWSPSVALSVHANAT